MSKLFLILGSVNAALAIMLGAFGSHGLKVSLSIEMMNIYQTGIQYHVYHAFGLLIIGLIAFQFPGSKLLRWSGWLMFSGIIFFSGSLYLQAITNIRWLGAITPIGGTAFITSWILLTMTALKLEQ